MVAVGRVARPHGRHGAVAINLETDFPERRFRPGSFVYGRCQGRVEALGIESVRFHKGRPILTFKGVDDMDRAEALALCELRVPPTALHELPDDQFYRRTLIGCSVSTDDGVLVGDVVAVEGVPGADRLIVRRNETDGEVDVPLAASICVKVDVERQHIVIRPPEGLLQLNG